MRHPLHPCGASHPKLAPGNVCTEPEGHTGGHVATDGCGRPEYYWHPPAPVDPADWTPEQAAAAQAELDELERTDPDVAAAAASYDRMVERITGRR